MESITVDLTHDREQKNSVSRIPNQRHPRKKGIVVAEQSSIDALTQRGYGTSEDKVFTLTFFEALYLADKGMLEVEGEKGKAMNFQDLCAATKPSTRTPGSATSFTAT